MSTSDDLFQKIYDGCGYINWRADEIKAAQVEIEKAARELQGSVPPPVDPPVDPVDPPIDPPGELGEGVKLGPANLSYLGAFRLPEGTAPGCAYGFGYALTGFAFNPLHHSLFVNNHVYEQRTAEVTIPTPSLDPNALPVAQYLQHPVDIVEGRLMNVGAGGAAVYDPCQVGGLLSNGDKIVGTSYIFYDGGKQAMLSHFYSNALVSESGDLRGMFDVGDLQSGFYAGYMGLVPPEWQDAIGGPALTGQGCLSIISRTSFGPAAFAFDPFDLTTCAPNGGATVAAQPLVYYDEAHPTLGDWNQQDHVNLEFNMASRVNGIVFPSGSRTVLFFGVQGLGVPCYGEADRSEPVPPGEWPDGHCYDPVLHDKGCHGYPYQPWVWAYDANDLVAVRNGQKQPWDVRPYEVWGLNLPRVSADGQIQGAAYDPSTQRIYLSNVHALPDMSPIVHVFQLVGANQRRLARGVRRG